jgi:hemerythrin-like domain-containing protein
LNIIRWVYEKIQFSADQSDIDLIELFSSIERYCKNLFERLTKEEDELFPIARRFLSFDKWFAIAEKCLCEDAKNMDDRNFKRILIR